MSDRPRARLFTIRFDREIRMLQVVAADAPTREWCILNNIDVMLEAAFRTFLGRPVADEPEPGERTTSGVVTPREVAGAIEKQLRETFPDESIAVRSTL